VIAVIVIPCDFGRLTRENGDIRVLQRVIGWSEKNSTTNVRSTALEYYTTKPTTYGDIISSENAMQKMT
jgi:hypothetical protein